MSSVRLATHSDAGALAELAERTFRDTFSADNSAADMDVHCAQRFGVVQQLAELHDPNMRSFLAGPAQAPSGFAQLRIASRTASVEARRPAELYRIYVSAEAKGQGVAQQLMQTVIEVARAAHADRLWLGVWEHNVRALAFYRRHGFSECGEHDFVLGQDRQRDLILQRPLR